MDKYEVCNIIALVVAYKIIIFLIVLYELTRCRRSEMEKVFTIKSNYTP